MPNFTETGHLKTFDKSNKKMVILVFFALNQKWYSIVVVFPNPMKNSRVMAVPNNIICMIVMNRETVIFNGLL